MILHIGPVGRREWLLSVGRMLLRLWVSVMRGWMLRMAGVIEMVTLRPRSRGLLVMMLVLVLVQMLLLLWLLRVLMLLMVGLLLGVRVVIHC